MKFLDKIKNINYKKLYKKYIKKNITKIGVSLLFVASLFTVHYIDGINTKRIIENNNSFYIDYIDTLLKKIDELTNEANNETPTDIARDYSYLKDYIVIIDENDSKLALNSNLRKNYTKIVFKDDVFAYPLYNNVNDLKISTLFHYLYVDDSADKYVTKLTFNEYKEMFNDNITEDIYINSDNLFKYISYRYIAEYFKDKTGVEAAMDKIPNSEADLEMGCTHYIAKYDEYIHTTGHGWVGFKFDNDAMITRLTGEGIGNYFHYLKDVYDLGNNNYRFVFDTYYISETDISEEVYLPLINSYLNGEVSEESLPFKKETFSDTYVMRKDGNNWYYVSHGVYLSE